MEFKFKETTFFLDDESVLFQYKLAVQNNEDKKKYAKMAQEVSKKLKKPIKEISDEDMVGELTEGDIMSKVEFLKTVYTIEDFNEQNTTGVKDEEKDFLYNLVIMKFDEILGAKTAGSKKN